MINIRVGGLGHVSRFEDYQKVIGRYPRLFPWVGIYSALRFLVCPFHWVESAVPPAGLVVDVGCGYGLFANLLALRSPLRKVIGFDVDAARVAVARSAATGRTNLSFFVAREGMSLPPCDAVTLLDVLHHIGPQPRLRLLEEIFDKLKPGGSLIIKDLDTVPRSKYLWNCVHDWVMTRGETCYYLGLNDMCNLLRQVGFAVTSEVLESHEPYSHVLYRCRKSSE